MNIDYAVCQALNYIEGSESGLLVYDVCCQWVLHFIAKVSNESPFSQYARSKRPAQRLLPIVSLGTLRACQQISADPSQSVWAGSRSDQIGPPQVQSVWAECH